VKYHPFPAHILTLYTTTHCSYTTVPGYHPHSYDAALVLMGSDMALEEATAVKLPPVCHTCRVQKPLRSKHCKVLRKCVCKFDHFW